MTANQFTRSILVLLAFVASAASAAEPMNWGAEQYVPFGLRNTPDWQWFAPVDSEGLESSGDDGYFFTAERLRWWLSKSDRAPVGVETDLPVRGVYSSTIHHSYGLSLADRVTQPDQLSFVGRFVVTGPASEIFSTNSIAQANPTTTGGWGNRWSAGWVTCLLYTSPSPRDATLSRMPSSA